jgi:PAS domain S-box-containing protein
MPLADPALGFVKILRDRTRQHRAEKQVQDSEELFRLLATNIPQLVFRSRTDGGRTWASPQWSVFTGLDFADGFEFGWLEAVHPDDREATMAAWAEASTSRDHYVEHRIRRHPDGEYRWHQTRAVPLDSGDGTTLEWVGTSADIHDLRTLQERQKVLLAELQHRTRNLLAVVQSIARQTARSSRSLDAFTDEYESRLRALGRVQALVARTDQQPIDLGELVASELQAHAQENGEPGRIAVRGPAALLPAPSAQSLALALHELATNAVKHGALGRPGGKLSIGWSIEEDGPGRRVRIAWRESGVAMPGRRSEAQRLRQRVDRARAALSAGRQDEAGVRA